MSARNPEDCDRLFGEGVNAGDAAAVVALYEPHAVLVFEGETLTGAGAIRGFLDAMLATQPRIEMNVTRVLRSDDLAVLYNDWRMTATGSDGERVESSGKAIEVVRRQADGTWKYVLDDPRARG